MSPRRARLIRRQSAAEQPNGRFYSMGNHVRQVQEDGKIKRFFTGLKEALAKPKTYVVQSQVFSPRSTLYRTLKRAWVRRRRNGGGI